MRQTKWAANTSFPESSDSRPRLNVPAGSGGNCPLISSMVAGIEDPEGQKPGASHIYSSPVPQVASRWQEPGLGTTRTMTSEAVLRGQAAISVANL
jgi:hypothetical protein